MATLPLEEADEEEAEAGMAAGGVDEIIQATKKKGEEECDKNADHHAIDFWHGHLLLWTDTLMDM